MSPFKIMDQLPYLLTVKTKNEMEEITIKKAQKMVDNWVNTLGVRYFNELTNMAILTEEVGEVARIMARKFGEQSNKKSDIKYELADELADVVFVLICIANQTGIELEKAFIKNIDKNLKSRYFSKR